MHSAATRVRAVCIAFATLFGGCVVDAQVPEGPKAAKIDAEAILKEVAPSLVVVRVTPTDKAAKAGSPIRGAVLDPSGLIGFPCRTTTQDDTVECEFSDGTSLRATALYCDNQTGIAVARVQPKQTLTAIKLADTKGVKKNETWALSLSFVGDEPFSEPSLISAVRDKSAKKPPSFEVDTATSHPVRRDLLLTGNGELLGIGGVVEFVPSSELPELLKAAPKKPD